MSLGDPVLIEYLFRRKSYILTRGRETFYNDDREMIEFDTAEEARRWSVANLGIEPAPVGSTEIPDDIHTLPLFGDMADE